MLRAIARIAGVLASLALGAVGIPALALSGVVSVDLLRNDEAWYFPGDPPLADFGVELGAVSVVAWSALLAVAWWMGWWTRRRWLRRILVVTFGIAVASMGPPFACIAQRHFGEWAKLRAFVWQQVETARAEGLSARPFEPPLEFGFAGRPEPVRIRSVTTGRWPGVVIDFGNGGNAGFDLRTMWCDYSD